LQRAQAEQKTPGRQARYKAAGRVTERKISYFSRRPWSGRKARARVPSGPPPTSWLAPPPSTGAWRCSVCVTARPVGLAAKRRGRSRPPQPAPYGRGQAALTGRRSRQRHNGKPAARRGLIAFWRREGPLHRQRLGKSVGRDPSAHSTSKAFAAVGSRLAAISRLRNIAASVARKTTSGQLGCDFLVRQGLSARTYTPQPVVHDALSVPMSRSRLQASARDGHRTSLGPRRIEFGAFARACAPPRAERPCTKRTARLAAKGSLPVTLP
jgi:hypothetical protein